MKQPRFVAGVPPDYFSAQGQLWGNPVYDWDAVRRTGYRWCLDRIRARLVYVDLIRLDHFRAFAAAWQIPSGAATAQTGQWVSGSVGALLIPHYRMRHGLHRRETASVDPGRPRERYAPLGDLARSDQPVLSGSGKRRGFRIGSSGGRSSAPLS